MSKSKKIVLGIILVIAVVAGTVEFIRYNNIRKIQLMETVLETDTIYDGISINGELVGGLTKEEAFKFLDTNLNTPLKAKNINITHEEEKHLISFSDLKVEYNIKKAIETAYSTARAGELEERYKMYKDIKGAGLNILADVQYDKQAVKEKMDEIDKLVSKDAVDSSMVRENGKFVITDEETGYKMNIEKTQAAVVALLEKGENGTVEAQFEEALPEITREKNEQSTDLLGTFYTKYSGGDSGRNENLVVGSKNINGTLVKPGEVFSTNLGLGPQTYANGYRDAAVIVNGKIEDGLAGGVCQITTTLYNAVVKAELEIVERKNHSLAVGYVPLGQDAAIAGDYTDFKFKNSSKYPVYLETYAANGKLVASVYGHEERSEGRTVELETVYIGSIPKPAEKITKDQNLPEGTRIVTYTGKIGHKVSTYKKVFENGKLLSREWFSDSTYKAVADEVTVGTGPVAVEEPVIPPVEEAPASTELSVSTETPIPLEGEAETNGTIEQ